MTESRLISLEVKALSNLIMRALARRLPHDEEPLTGMQRWVIGYLGEHAQQDIYQRDLEAEFHIRRSTASGILRILEQRGLLRREAVAADARLKKLVLTEKALERRRRVEAEILALENELRQGLSDEDCQRFFELAERMRRRLEQSAGSAEGCRCQPEPACSGRRAASHQKQEGEES